MNKDSDLEYKIHFEFLNEDIINIFRSLSLFLYQIVNSETCLYNPLTF